MEPLASKAPLLGVGEGVQANCLPLQTPLLPALSFSLFLIFPLLLYLFIFGQPPPPPGQPRAWDLCVWTAFSNSSAWVSAEWKPDGPAVSHCYLPVDSGRAPSSPPSLAWQKYLPLFRETRIRCPYLFPELQHKRKAIYSPCGWGGARWVDHAPNLTSWRSRFKPA